MLISYAMQTAPRYVEETEEIWVFVSPEYLHDESNPEEGLYAFAYHIRMENRGSEPARLVRRHWIINSGSNFFNEVYGEGVVGEKPRLEPGGKFEYTSWSTIQDAMGSMRGEYVFVRDDGRAFEVQIPEFDLVHPGLIQ